MLQGPIQNTLKADVLDVAPVIIAIHDTDQNIVWANKAYQNATGLSLEEIQGKKCYSVWRLAKSCRGCPVNTAIQTGEQHEAELTPKNQDHWPASQGSWLSKAAPIRDADGNIIGVVETAYEITDRKLTEEALIESEERYRQLFNNESDAVMIFDAESKQFEEANPATLDLFGYSKEEFVNLIVEDIFAEKTKTKTAVEKIISGDSEGKYIPLRYFKKKDGMIFPSEVYTGTFISNKRKMIIGAVRDITKRMQAEEAV